MLMLGVSLCLFELAYAILILF